jgi:tetratricopeptide (TPR) repeat protein
MIPSPADGAGGEGDFMRGGPVCTSLLLGLAFAAPAAAQSPEQLVIACLGNGGASLEQAVEACTALLKPGVAAPMPAAQLHYSRALALLNQRKLEPALADLDRSIELDPGDAAVVYERALVLGWLGQYVRAVTDYGEVIRLRPGDATARNGRGFANLKLDRIESALADFGAVLKDDPKDATALFGRGLARRQKGETEAGNADIAQAKALDDTVAARMSSFGFGVQ